VAQCSGASINIFFKSFISGHNGGQCNSLKKETDLMPKKQAKPAATKPGYIPTRKERAAIEKVINRYQTASPTPGLKILNNQISIDHPDRLVGELLVMEALGASTLHFMYGMLKHMANAGSQGNKADESELNFMVSIVKDIKPRDHIEAMLAAQMACVHVMSMRFAHYLGNTDNLYQQDSAERTFNKLTRTFPTQMEALKRHRAVGDQNVAAPQPSNGESESIDGKKGSQDTSAEPKLASDDLRTTGSKVVPMRRKAAR
jgi:hypothetical protein